MADRMAEPEIPKVAAPLHGQPGARSRFAWLHPKAYLGVFGVSGLLLAIGLLWGFFAIAEDVPEKGRMDQFDASVVTWLQVHGSERGEAICSVISFIGSPLLIAIVVIAAAWLARRHDWRRFGLLVVAAGGGLLLDQVLKAIYQRARPASASEFVSSLSSWSFPSGHAMGSLVGYGVLAYLALAFVRGSAARRWIVGGTMALILAIGLSRIYLGVHFPSDVIAGYLAGSVWLQVCISGYRFADRRRVGPAASAGSG